MVSACHRSKTWLKWLPKKRITPAVELSRLWRGNVCIVWCFFMIGKSPRKDRNKGHINLVRWTGRWPHYIDLGATMTWALYIKYSFLCQCHHENVIFVQFQLQGRPWPRLFSVPRQSLCYLCKNYSSEIHSHSERFKLKCYKLLFLSTVLVQ